MPLIEGIRGLLNLKGGRFTPGSAGIGELSASLLIQEAGGRYEESVWNGEVFTVVSALVTAPVLGPLGAAGTPIVALWNPAGSGFVGLIRRIGAITTTNGTVGPGGYSLDIGPTNPITAAANAPGLKNDGTGGTDTDLKGFSNTALTGSSALSRLRPINGTGTAAAAALIASQAEEISGAVILMPGSLMAITPFVTGTANIAICFIEYAKRKIS